MTTEQNNLIDVDAEAQRLITKIINDFVNRVAKEIDLSIILLRGHLLIECYLNYLVILLHDKNERIDNQSFFNKIKILENDNCFGKNVLNCLYKLNDVRNNLSHEIEYKVSESAIDSVGFSLGKEYILEKFKTNHEDAIGLRNLFVWVLHKILTLITFPIFQEIVKQKRENIQSVQNLQNSSIKPIVS